MIGERLFGAGGPSTSHWLRAALAVCMLLLLAAALPARADYVTGLNPAGDNYLSLRDGPGAGYREIVRMGPDTIVTVLERRGDWRRVRLEDGTTGWASGRYIRAGLPPGYEPAPEPRSSPHSGRAGASGATPLGAPLSTTPPICSPPDPRAPAAA